MSQDLPPRQSEADKDIGRIYHRIENTKFNAYQGFLLAKELQDSLRKRRNVKNDLQIANEVMKWVGNVGKDITTIAKRFDKWNYWEDDEKQLSDDAAMFQQEEAG
jgi:hypothetical protein